MQYIFHPSLPWIKASSWRRGTSRLWFLFRWIWKNTKTEEESRGGSFPAAVCGMWLGGVGRWGSTTSIQLRSAPPCSDCTDFRGGRRTGKFRLNYRVHALQIYKEKKTSLFHIWRIKNNKLHLKSILSLHFRTWLVQKTWCPPGQNILMLNLRGLEIMRSLSWLTGGRSPTVSSTQGRFWTDICPLPEQRASSSQPTYQRRSGNRLLPS